jgi:segregation and condensation protein B
MDNKVGVLEGLLFVVGDDGLTFEQISDALDVDLDSAKDLVLELKHEYESERHGIQIAMLGDKIKLTTKKEHKDYYIKLIENKETNSLSQQALETLAIIAYNEPITVQEIDNIRGVNSREMVRRLLAKGFVKEAGKSELPGKPMSYSTTSDFLDYFGLASKEDLPKFNIEEEGNIDETDLYDSKYTEVSDINE